MISQMKSIIFTLIAIFGFQISAWAAPQIDPRLEPLMNGSVENTEMVTVIATFKDPQFLPYLSNSIYTYQDVRWALQQNAYNAQKDLYDILKNGAESNNIPMKMTSIWLANAMIIEMPAYLVRYLAEYDQIDTLIADYEMSIIMPWDGGETQPWASLEANDYTYGLKKLQLPELREAAPNINGEGVNVGIIDTGIEASHPDLQGKTIGFKDFVSNNSDPYDDQGHGTHVAGTIAGGFASGTAIGVAPNVKLTIAKVFDRRGGATFARILKAMEWIADPDGDPNTNDAPALVSNSWGGGSSSSRKDPSSEALCKAVTNWVKLGIFPVFAAGNSGSRASSVGLPAACPDAFSVGATDKNDRIASFSSRGPAQWSTGNIIKPEVSAPGVNVTSSFLRSSYRQLSGTSMATPHVAGMAALLYQVAPDADVSSMAQAIIRGVNDLGPDGQDNDFGWGRINALQSIRPQQ